MSHISSGKKLCHASDRQTDVCSYLVTSRIIIYNEQYVVHSLVSFYPLKYYNTFSKASTYISWRCVLTNRMEEKKMHSRPTSRFVVLYSCFFLWHWFALSSVFHHALHYSALRNKWNKTQQKKRKIRFEKHHSGREILAFFL